jgi:hypothetical protein
VTRGQYVMMAEYLLAVALCDFSYTENWRVTSVAYWTRDVAVCVWYGKGKGKAIPLQALTGPEGSRSLRLPDFKTIGT